jgi:2-hydroxy-3-keto-5-methylthiopentenyl-1-phosphate phosphatase
MTTTHVAEAPRHFLVASDFDQTLSFNDSGTVLSDLLGVSGFESKVDGLRRSNLVHQGGELAYLIRHDPEFRSVRREHLVEAGRSVRLKNHIPELVDFLAHGVDGFRFSFYVVSAAPREVIESALEGIVPADHIFGTELDYDEASGEIRSVRQVPAGYGKVEVIEGIERRLGVSPERTVYVGDGSSDVHVMLHVNNRDGFTIAVSENKLLTRIAQRTVLSDSALSVLVPMLRRIGWRSAAIRAVFDSFGLPLREWERVRTDWLTIGESHHDQGDQSVASTHN